jgi:hypothetical protein
MPLLRERMTLCGKQNVLAKDKSDETVDILHVTTRKEPAEMENKKTKGKELDNCYDKHCTGKKEG